MKKILICMGSSCFARENRENLHVIEDFLKSHGIQDSVKIEGSLCLGQCHRGPNIIINGNSYHEVRGEELPEILRKELIEL